MLTLREFISSPLHESSENIIRMDVPFLIRILEHAREEVKSDDALHQFVEKIINRGAKTLTMEDFLTIEQV